jgi:bifunctional UDP-N-acetylglucosamine pyrophosphorylase/glucosamine-1-phosphate N-acetyltransferase
MFMNFNGMPININQGIPQHVQEKKDGLQIVILAGGKGERMNSGVIPKVLCKVRGKEMLLHILEEISRIQCDEIFIVVNPQNASLIEAILNKSRLIVLSKTRLVLQRESNGTGGALQCVLPNLDKNKSTLVLNGDMPNIKAEMITEFIKKNMEEKSEMGLVTALLDEPLNYGRIIRKNDRSKDRAFLKIIEKKDCINAEELETKEINAGIYYFSNIILHIYLGKLNNNNKAGEYYLTSIFDEIRKKEDTEVLLYVIPKSQNNLILGINTPEELIYAEKNFL